MSLADIERRRSHPLRWALIILAVLCAIIAPYWFGRSLAVNNTDSIVAVLEMCIRDSGNTVGYGNIAYMTSDNPMGPFTYQGEILKNPSTYFGVGGNNHHAMVQLGEMCIRDRWCTE